MKKATLSIFLIIILSVQVLASQPTITPSEDTASERVSGKNPIIPNDAEHEQTLGIEDTWDITLDEIEYHITLVINENDESIILINEDSVTLSAGERFPLHNRAYLVPSEILDDQTTLLIAYDNSRLLSSVAPTIVAQEEYIVEEDEKISFSIEYNSGDEQSIHHIVSSIDGSLVHGECKGECDLGYDLPLSLGEHTLHLNVLVGESKVYQRTKEILVAEQSSSETFFIEDLDVYVGTDADLNIENEEDGYLIAEDLEVEDKIRFEVDIRNYNQLSLDNVQTTLKMRGAAQKLEDQRHTDYLQPGEKVKHTLTLATPLQIEERAFRLQLDITANDEQGKEYEISKYFLIESDKKAHEIRILSTELENEIVSCEENGQLEVEVINLGAQKEESVAIEVLSEDIGLVGRQVIVSGLDDGTNPNARKISEVPINPEYGVNGRSYPVEVRVIRGARTVETTTEVDIVLEDCKLPEFPIDPIRIHDLDIELGETQNNELEDKNEEKLQGLIRPGEQIIINTEIYNTLDFDADFIVHANIPIAYLDGDELDESSNKIPIASKQANDEFEIALDIDPTTLEGTYTLNLEYEALHSDFIRKTTTKTFTFEVRRETENLQITELFPQREVLACNREAVIEYTVANSGLNEESIRTRVTNEELGISDETEREILLYEGEESEVTYRRTYDMRGEENGQKILTVEVERLTPNKIWATMDTQQTLVNIQECANPDEQDVQPTITYEDLNLIYQNTQNLLETEQNAVLDDTLEAGRSFDLEVDLLSQFYATELTQAQLVVDLINEQGQRFELGEYQLNSLLEARETPTSARNEHEKTYAITPNAFLVSGQYTLEIIFDAQDQAGQDHLIAKQYQVELSGIDAAVTSVANHQENTLATAQQSSNQPSDNSVSSTDQSSGNDRDKSDSTDKRSKKESSKDKQRATESAKSQTQAQQSPIQRGAIVLEPGEHEILHGLGINYDYSDAKISSTYVIDPRVDIPLEATSMPKSYFRALLEQEGYYTLRITLSETSKINYRIDSTEVREALDLGYRIPKEYSVQI